MKYADQFTEWLLEEGYTHCFFVAGGNIMHLLDSVRLRMTCVPFVHEVGAGIAAEYFNETRPHGTGKAFALVTAGPGLTNILTAMAGAFLESRQLLVVGGQVKSTDLSRGQVRQRGIQEVDGLAMAAPVCKAVIRIESPQPRAAVLEVIRSANEGRPGPVFVEFCLDAQGAPRIDPNEPSMPVGGHSTRVGAAAVEDVADQMRAASRPLVLLGGGVSRVTARGLVPRLSRLGLPLATTWNGADRVGSEDPAWAGRPNTWGMRWANVVLQQSDLLVAVGTRLGMQQTGFNWQGFAPEARVIQVDIDPAELQKGHPRVEVPLVGDANGFLQDLESRLSAAAEQGGTPKHWLFWREFVTTVRSRLPLAEASNTHGQGFIDPYDFVVRLSRVLDASDVIVPCSSGGAFTVMMQAFEQRSGQTLVTDKGLASMGYGLSGAIGAALANVPRRTILVEGDGGMAQNLQEFGTLAAQGLNVKTFIFANEGYASIRMTQRNYFGGAYLGCDTSTGLGLPNWQALLKGYGIPVHSLRPEDPFDDSTRALLSTPGPAAFIVPIDPEQTYHPKINSRVRSDGGMESSPLHLMYPPLDLDLSSTVTPFLTGESNT